MTIKCTACGMDFPVESAKCKECGSTMACAEGTCTCVNCGHKQSADKMWCPACLEKNQVS